MRECIVLTLAPRTRTCSSCCRITENIVTSETKTEDNVFVRVSCAVQQQPKASRVKDCVYRLRNPRAQIESYVGDVVRGQVPNMTLEEVSRCTPLHMLRCGGGCVLLRTVR